MPSPATELGDFGGESANQRHEEFGGCGEAGARLAQALVEIAAAIDFELERVDAAAGGGVAV